MISINKISLNHVALDSNDEFVVVYVFRIFEEEIDDSYVSYRFNDTSNGQVTENWSSINYRIFLSNIPLRNDNKRCKQLYIQIIRLNKLTVEINLMKDQINLNVNGLNVVMKQIRFRWFISFTIELTINIKLNNISLIDNMQFK